MTRVNKRFIMHCTGSEGTGSKVSQLITKFIVLGKDKTTKRASKAMLHCEWVATAIAVRGEVWGIWHSKDKGMLASTLEVLIQMYPY